MRYQTQFCQNCSESVGKSLGPDMGPCSWRLTFGLGRITQKMPLQRRL